MNRKLVWMGCLPLLAGCVTQDLPRDVGELLPDPTFSQWFHIKGLGQPWDDGKPQGIFRSSAELLGTPVWGLAQWAAPPSLADPAATRQYRSGADTFVISNASKRVTVDSRRGEIELAVSASACHERPRRRNEPWPHLLAEAPLTDKRHPSEACRVEAMTRLDVSLDCCLAAFEDRHPDANPSLHAAQFQLFLYVQNLNTESPGYGDMLWFGIPVFDNRRPGAPGEHYQRDGGKPDASSKFIYAMPASACQPNGNTFFKNGAPAASPAWTAIRADVLPFIRRACTLAREGGYLAATDPADLYVSGLNIGWEMPGTYDAAMRIRRFSISRTAKKLDEKPERGDEKN